MRILIANAVLFGRTGTEVVTAELAQALAARDHQVVVFSPMIGETGEDLRTRGIRVTDSLHDLDFEPQIIHGNHAVELVHALIRFPQAPGLFVCHDPKAWISEPPGLSRIRAYVAVCGLTAQRIRHAVPGMAAQVRFVPNAVDLDRFAPRPPLPVRPLRALALTKYSGHLGTLRAACRRAGVPLDVVGPGSGEVVDDLPERLRGYDLVFATARMAIEAMAVGCAVVVVDERGLAGLATSGVAEDWRARNFGMEVLTRPVTEEALVAEIARYDAADAAAVAADVRTAQPLSRIVQQYEALYRDVIAEHAAVPPAVEGREMSRLMQSWLPAITGSAPIAATLASAASPPKQPRPGFWERLGRSIDKRPGLRRTLQALGFRRASRT